MNTLQTFWLSALDKIISGLPAIIAAIGAAWIARNSINKKTVEKADETNKVVQQNTDEQNKKLDSVHETVNGNYSALLAKHDAAVAENTALREQLAHAMKRSSDRKKKAAP